MSKLYRRIQRAPALPPGTVAAAPGQRNHDTTIQVFDYLGEELTERSVDGFADCLGYRDSGTTTWINFVGLQDLEALKGLSEHFGIHPLVQEDVVNTHQRPKVEDFDSYLYIVLHMLYLEPGDFAVRSEQISLILHGDTVISFQEVPGDVFEGVRDRLRKGKGRIRTWGADYLLYALLDAVVDNYFLMLERTGDLIDDLEAQLLVHPEPGQLAQVHAMKREMIILRKAIWPLREVIAKLERTESVLLDDRISPFLRDVYDHTVQVAESVETFRDMLSGLQDLYLSSVSNKMNEVMKVLTVTATIFVPLTFVAGIYGMNFEHMPELGWSWSYPAFWGVITTAAAGMLVFFKRRKYL
jgi:magnesium transporter